jgi:excisionase family DNA binding protein
VTPGEDFERLLTEAVRREVERQLVPVRQEFAWVSTKEAAELLGVTPRAVRDKVRRGLLPGRRLDGHVYIERAKLADAIRRSPRA